MLNMIKKSFFPSSMTEWSKVNSSIRNSDNLALFLKSLLTFIRASAKSIATIEFKANYNIEAMPESWKSPFFS